jgi:hypothetical protein
MQQTAIRQWGFFALTGPIQPGQAALSGIGDKTENVRLR